MLVGAPIAAVHSTVQVQDQTDLQVMRNSTGTGVGGAAPTWSFSTTPTVDLSSAWGRWTLGLKYTAAFSARSIESAATLDVMQQGTLSLVWRTRTFRLVLSEVGSYGTMNYATTQPTTPGAPSTPPTALQAVPVNVWLLTGSSRSMLTLTQTFTRRLEGSLYGGWSLSGGVDDTSRAILPSQEGPLAGGRFLYTLSRLDSLEGRIDFARVAFSSTVCTNAPTVVGVTITKDTPYCTPTDDAWTVMLGWRHRLSRTTDLTVQGGVVAAGLQHDAGKPYTPYVYPAAGVGLARRTRTRSWGSETTLRFSVQLAPIISPQTGAVDQRLQGDVGVDWANEHFIVRGAARASQSVPFDADGAYFTTNLEASVGLRLDRSLTVSVGGRFDWQRYATSPTLTSDQSLAAGLGFVRLQVASRVFSF